MKKVVLFLLLMVLALNTVSCKTKTGNEKNIVNDSINLDRKVYMNGKVFTSNKNGLYADGFVVEDGKFLFVGNNDELKKYADGLPTEKVIDLNGKRVIPGLIEGHTHMSFMSVLDSLNYYEVPDNIDLDESLSELKRFVSEHPDYDQYVLGNFSQNFELNAKMIDEICEDKPVMLIGMGLHCGYMNTLFMANGNITRDTIDTVPNESYLIRDEEGNPTGRIVELPQTWDSFKRAIKIDNKKVSESLKKMIALYNSYGFTGVTEGGFLGLDENNILSVLKSLEDENKLSLLICPATIWYGHTVSSIDEIRERALYQKNNFTTKNIRPGTVKMWADGTLGAYSALLREPYDVEGETIYGKPLSSEEDLYLCASMCKENDLNVHFHAIGDKAIENVLSAYEKVGTTTGVKSLVHFEINPEDLIERASKINGLIINMTPTWANNLVEEEINGIGARRDHFCQFAETMERGIIVDFGSDSNGSREVWNPVLNICASVMRNPDVETVLLKGKPITIEDAIMAYSINVAKERRVDNEFGSIEIGKSADFNIMNTDFFVKDVFDLIKERKIVESDKSIVYPEKVYFRGELVCNQ